jgi:PAS domain S-box-containing protein
MELTTAPACLNCEALRSLDDALRRNTALFEAIVNSADGIALTRADRRIFRVIHSLTGRVPGELAGVLAESIFLPEDRHIVIDCYRNLLHRHCGTIKFEARAVHANGSIMYLSGSLSDMLDDPNVQAIVCNYSDITLRKQADLKLAEIAAISQSGNDFKRSGNLSFSEPDR